MFVCIFFKNIVLFFCYIFPCSLLIFYIITLLPLTNDSSQIVRPVAALTDTLKEQLVLPLSTGFEARGL